MEEFGRSTPRTFNGFTSIDICLTESTEADARKRTERLLCCFLGRETTVGYTRIRSTGTLDSC